MEIINQNAERDFREAERNKLTPTVTTLKRTRYYTTRHNDLCVTTEIKEYTKKTTYVYPSGQKPPELDNISLKSNHVQENNKCSKKFMPIGSVELDVLLKAHDPFDISGVDTETHSHIYPIKDSASDTSSFTSKDFNITSDNVTSEKCYETALNHPGEPKKELQFDSSDRESVGPETCKVNRLSYNQAMRDKRLCPEQSDTSSSSSSTPSDTFADSTSHESVGTHKKSFLPKFLNFCKGPDTHSIDRHDSPDSVPETDPTKLGPEITAKPDLKDPDVEDLPTVTSDASLHVEKTTDDTSSSHSHGDNTTSSTTSDKSEDRPLGADIDAEFKPPELDLDEPKIDFEADVPQIKISDPNLAPELEAGAPLSTVLPYVSVDKNLQFPSTDSDESRPKVKAAKSKFSPFSICTSKPKTTSVESLNKLSEQSLSDMEPSVPDISSHSSISVSVKKPDLEGLSDLPAIPKVELEAEGDLSGELKSPEYELDLKKDGDKSDDDSKPQTSKSSETSKSSKSQPLDIKIDLTKPDVELGVHAADRADLPKSDHIHDPDLSAQVKTPLDVFPKARRLKEPKQPKYNPFKRGPGNPLDLCGLRGKPETSSEITPPKPPKRKQKPSPSCLGGGGSVTSASLTEITKPDYKDDTLPDDQSLASLESFALTSSIIRDPPAHQIDGPKVDGPKVEVDVDGNLEDVQPTLDHPTTTPSALGSDTALELQRGIDLEPPDTDDHDSVSPPCAPPLRVKEPIAISKPLENDKLKSVDDDKSIGRVSSRLSALTKPKEKKRFKLPRPCGGTHKSPDLSSTRVKPETSPPKSEISSIKPPKETSPFLACCGGKGPPSPKPELDIVPLTEPPAVPKPFSGTIKADIDASIESSPVVSVTQDPTDSYTTTTDAKRRGSGVLGGLFDKIRGRKAKREVQPLTRSHSIPVSIYASTESLYIVTYRIKKRRTQSCPASEKKRKPTVITIDCRYEDAPALITPKYVTDIVQTFKKEGGVDTDALKKLDVVHYHENVLKTLKNFKENKENDGEEEGEEKVDPTESHIYTTCYCATNKSTKINVGMSTGCDIIQHEEYQGECIPYEGETAEMGTQTDPEETDYNPDDCNCQLCQALAAHLSEIALTMGVGDEPIHLYVHVCQTCPALPDSKLPGNEK